MRMRNCCSDQCLFHVAHVVQRTALLSFKFAMKVVGPVLHGSALVLIFGISLVYFLFVFPSLLEKSPSSMSYFLHLMLSTYLVVNVFYNLVACAWTPPGSPKSVRNPGKVLGMDEYSTPSRGQQPRYSLRKKCTLKPGVYYKYCKTCRAVKPPRAHHCSVTDRCVYEMDHYCPWMNNCIGLYNYRYFFFFLVYLFIACGYFILTVGYKIITLTNRKDRLKAFGTDYPIEVMGLAFVVALGALISVGLLLVWHCYLVLTNQTTIEFYVNIENRLEAKNTKAVFENPFDQGFQKNIARLLGKKPWFYCLFPSSHSPASPLYPLSVQPGVLTGDYDLRV